MEYRSHSEGWTGSNPGRAIFTGSSKYYRSIAQRLSSECLPPHNQSNRRLKLRPADIQDKIENRLILFSEHPSHMCHSEANAVKSNFYTFWCFENCNDINILVLLVEGFARYLLFYVYENLKFQRLMYQELIFNFVHIPNICPPIIIVFFLGYFLLYPHQLTSEWLGNFTFQTTSCESTRHLN